MTAPAWLPNLSIAAAFLSGLQSFCPFSCHPSSSFGRIFFSYCTVELNSSSIHSTLSHGFFKRHPLKICFYSDTSFCLKKKRCKYGMLSKRSYLASDMTSKNVFKIKSKCCTRHVSRQLLSVVRASYWFKHISVPAKAFQALGPCDPCLSAVHAPSRSATRGTCMVLGLLLC